MLNVAVIGVACAILAWLGRLVGASRRAARAAQCSGRLCQTALVLLIDHDTFGSFPPAFVADARGQPMHSWRVLILPYIGVRPS